MKLRKFKLENQESFKNIEAFRDELGIERQYDDDYENTKYTKGKLVKNKRLKEDNIPVTTKVKKEFSRAMKFFKKPKEIFSTKES